MGIEVCDGKREEEMGRFSWGYFLLCKEFANPINYPFNILLLHVGMQRQREHFFNKLFCNTHVTAPAVFIERMLMHRHKMDACFDVL
jgi:hypothetical protein